MSNFTGVTFAQQKVLPSDDAIIRRHILSDGILFGCELSYSGSTLTMAAGQLLACGRQFRHPSSQNWAVVDATSGYARLVLTVDLTKTSTKETFDQIDSTIEYASAVDGFPELEQADINVSGSRYQMAACVISLGTGGITGIVSQLGPCEVAGGGGLNFSVVGGLTQPANPKKNMIWVITDTAITSYIFSATESAAPEEGMVWFALGNSSTASFNALKKNAIILCPLYARQYRSGAWVEVQAKTFQNGAWADWSPMSVVIFEDGEFTSGSFGYVLESDSSYSRVEIADGFWKIVCSGSGTVYGYTTEAFDLTNISELIFTGEVESGNSSYQSTITFGVASAQEDAEFVAKQSFSTWGAANSDAYAVDVSSLSGRYYIKAMVERSHASYYHNLNISDIRSA